MIFKQQNYLYQKKNMTFKNNLKNKIILYILNNKDKIKINSASVERGDIFVCLKGEKTHGNNYIKEAIKKGSKYIITDNKFNIPTNKKNILMVKNSLDFLLKIANEKRKIYKGKIIGITGSVGKTTLKESLKFFLAKVCDVSASIKSYNNYLGVLISLLNINIKSDYALFEIGTNNFNEIRLLTSIILPHQTIITNISPTHLENFKNNRNIALEKSDIFNKKYNPYVNFSLIPQFNKDELLLLEKAKNNDINDIITFGENKFSNYYVTKKLDKNNLKISIISKKEKYIFETKYIQYHQIVNIMICLIIFKYNKINLDKFFKQIKKIPKVEGRGLVNKIMISNKKINLIDESYNASPLSMKNCIEYFDETRIPKNNKKFLILGDMNELGNQAIKFHKILINQIKKTKIDFIILCGECFKTVLKKNDINKNIMLISDHNKIYEFLSNNVHNNDTILVKCSNSTKINKFAQMLLMNKRKV